MTTSLIEIALACIFLPILIPFVLFMAFMGVIGIIEALCGYMPSGG